MRLRTLKNAVALALILALSGCAIFKGKKPKPAAPASTVTASAPAVPTKKEPAKPVWYYISPITWYNSVAALFPRKKKTPTALPPQAVGTIKMVNKEDKFVLIDGASFRSTAPGDALLCIMDQKETANLRVSTLRNPPFVIADITSGMPSPGDRVYKP